MISRSGKGNFFAAHYEWLAAGVGILALVGAGAFCFLGRFRSPAAARNAQPWRTPI